MAKPPRNRLGRSLRRNPHPRSIQACFPRYNHPVKLPLIRWLLHFFSFISFLFFLATAFLWIRSHTMTDDIFWYSTDRMTRFRTSGGGFHFETRPWPFGAIPHREWHRIDDRALYPFATSSTSSFAERLGFLYDTEQYDLLLIAPYWSLALLTAPLPLLRLRAILLHRRRSRRITQNLCSSCGYDLRASTEKCPECGTTVPSTFDVQR